MRPLGCAVVLALAACRPGSPAPTVPAAPSGASALVAAVEGARPGHPVVIAAGTIVLDAPLFIRTSGEPDAWVTIRGEPGAILDARAIAVGAPTGEPPYPQDQGAVVLRGGHHVRIEGLTIVGSGNAGITVRDSTDVVIEGNHTEHTFSSGIAVWGTAGSSARIRIVDNEVVAANDPTAAPPWFDPETMMMPHEAITVGGAIDFDVVGNHVHHGAKEGIDVKGDSKRGVVRDNHVHHMARQGLYVDAWDGTIEAIELRDNQVTHCEGAGVVVSAEGEGAAVHGVEIHDNSIEDNLGSGVFVSRFGRDGPRRSIAIVDNVVRHNGWGPPHGEGPLPWITGGIYVFSTNVEAVEIRDNDVTDNQAFQIGVTEALVTGGVLSDRVVVSHNRDAPPPPVEVVVTGWPTDAPDRIRAVAGADGSSPTAAP